MNKTLLVAAIVAIIAIITAIVLAAPTILFLLAKFGGIPSDLTPLPGDAGPAEMLVIGASSGETLEILNDNPDLVHYRIIEVEELDENPAETLADYQIVMIDQSEQADKSVSEPLGEAIENYVKQGGSLIVVKDSGIKQDGAYDIIGWEANFGDVVPVRCDRRINNLPSCVLPIDSQGHVVRRDEDHPIMQGIEQFPADPMQHALFTTLDVTVSGNEIAYIQDAATKRTYPAIVEKNLIIGKSIYFNYNPGKTKGILENTLKYLR